MGDKMNDKLNEQLSAMFDGELEEHEHELLLHRLKQDEKMQKSFAHYQLIGDAMRHDLDKGATVDLVARVSRQLESESALTADRVAKLPMKILRPVAGLAVAASVAAMAVVGVQNVALQDQGPLQQSPRLAQVAPANDFRQVSGTNWNRSQPETEMRLNGYLVNHSEYTSGLSLQGMINYARIAGYDSKKK